jgi:uncharacterized membrane protein YidH (DUF202 family)
MGDPTNSHTRRWFDKLYGTRLHTEGAELQKPRMVPMRVEPKSHFANERTFLSWMGMAITMGGVSSALVSFQTTDSDPEHEQVISKRTIDIITCMYTPMAILMMLYALFTYEWRSHFMKKKMLGFFDDKIGPIAVAVLTLITLVTILVIAVMDFVY